jgi:hypothetical protein
MRDVVIFFVHLIVTVARLARPGGLRSVVAESALVRHQLLVLNRGRKRAPNLRAADRIIAGLCTLFIRPARVLRSAIVLKSSTLLHLHSLLRKRKYRMLFSSKGGRRPGPKGPKKELVYAVVDLVRHGSDGNPIIWMNIAQSGITLWGKRAEEIGERGAAIRHGQRPLSTGTGFGRSFLAYVSRPHEGQFVELRFIPMRIGNPENIGFSL